MQRHLSDELEVSIATSLYPIVRWIARCAVTTVVVCSVVLSVDFKPNSELASWLELVRFVPYPAYLLAALGAACLSLVLGWRWRLAALTGVGLVVIAVMGLAVGSVDSGSGRLRVMTYNIKSYHAVYRSDGLSHIAQEVTLHDPDIFVFQDSYGIADPIKDAHVSVQFLLRGRQWYSQGEYLVASRYPLRDCATGAIPYRGKKHTYVQQSYVRCTVVVDDTEIDLVTAHFLSPRDGLNSTRHDWFNGLAAWLDSYADRLTQAELLANELAAGVRPMIVAGDFNAPEKSAVVGALLAAGLRDAFSSAGLGYGYTWGHSLRLGISFFRIDHILVSPTLGIRDCFIGGKEGSEHRPVIADLLLKKS